MYSTEHQLLFGVLALQLEFITSAQFVEVCTVWASTKDRNLPDLLADRGWLRPQDKDDIERLLARKVERHGGDVAASLREVGGDPRVRATLPSIADDEIHLTLSPSPSLHRVSLISTQAHTTESLGRYTLNHVHATGGIGRVWLAHDSSLRREVALKELRPDRLASAFIQSRFLREAQVTGQLEHPGIVPIYEVGRRPEDDAPYYTMRFVRGRTLAEAIDLYHRHRKVGEESPLELRKLLTAFVGVCNAIAYAHSRGVLHRDLKPQNIVLGDFGEVMVLDWGLARVVDEPEPGPLPVDLEPTDEAGETRAGQVLGTPGYMSPEQAAGRHNLLGPETDVYGLGAILYHLFANRPPFIASTRDEAIRQAVEDPVPPLSELGAEAPPALEAVCRKALAKKIDDRYSSATALADEVQRWLADESVQAYPDTFFVRAGRWIRRHKTFVSAVAVFIVCTAAASSVAAVLIWREQQQTSIAWKEAEKEKAKATESADTAIKVVHDLGQYVRDFETTGTRQVRTDQQRKVQLDAALASYERLLTLKPDDADIRLSVGRMYHYRANLSRLLNETADAEAAYQTARRHYRDLVKARPEERVYQERSAETARDHGLLLMTLGRLSRASENLDEALRSYERFRQADPANVDYPRTIANMLLDRSDIDYQLGRFPASEQAARGSVDNFARLADAPAAHPETLDPLFRGMAENRMALALREQRRIEDAIAAHDAAVARLSALAKISPVRDVVIQHHRARSERGWTLGMLPNRRAAGAAELDLANVGLEALVKQYPHVPLYQRWQGIGRLYRGQLKGMLGERPSAVQDLTAAVKVFETLVERHPEIPAYRGDLGRAYMALGRLAVDPRETEELYAKARKALDEAVSRMPENVQLLEALKELSGLRKS